MKKKNKFQKVLMVLADVSENDLKPITAPAVQEPVITDLTAFHVEMPTARMCDALKSAAARYALVMADPDDTTGTTFGIILPLSGERTLYDKNSFTQWLEAEAHRIANQPY